MKKILMLVIICVFLSGCNESATITPKTLAEDEAACYQFIQDNMLVDGGVLTNYHKKPLSEELATGNEVLSESQGLLLNYTANIADKAVFDEVYQFTKKHLDKDKIFVYRYNPEVGKKEGYSINAAVDDLRIIKALFTAGEVFSDKKLTKAGEKYADRFYQSNVENDRLYDFYDTEHFMKNDFITLCYLDLEAITMIASTDKRYLAVYDNSLDILEGGYISDDFPMFMTRYNYSKNQYEVPNDINMIESVLTALNLAYADKCPPTTIDFLKQELEKGRVYASYKIDGTPKKTFESTAIYALCALLAQEIHDEQMYEKSIELMKQFMVTNKGSDLYGAFGDKNNVYSFDNLMALTALRKGVES